LVVLLYIILSLPFMI